MKELNKAAEKYPELVDASADWVEIRLDEYNTDLKNAFIAGANWQMNKNKRHRMQLTRFKNDRKKLLKDALKEAASWLSQTTPEEYSMMIMSEAEAKVLNKIFNRYVNKIIP